MTPRQGLLSRAIPALVVAAGLVGLAPALAAPATAGAAVPSLVPPHAVRNTGLLINPVFSQTLVGGFDQAGNTNLDCSTLTNGNPLPAGGCVRDWQTALGTGASGPGNRPFYNNQVITKYLNVAPSPGTGGVPGSITTTNSSSATVTVPTSATVVYAELSWLGTTQLSGNSPPDVPPGQSITLPPAAGGWDPNIYTKPMLASIGDDQHFVSVQPDQGTSIGPGQPGSDTNDYYYTASANVTPLLAGRTGQITVWGANVPFLANGFSMAGLGWNVTVVYQYPSVNLGATPPQVGKQITVQEGFVYQQANAPATNTVVDVPAITDPNQVQVGLIAGEGDAGLSGDTFSIDGVNIPHPVTGQTNNFFVSYAQGATNPNWTSNFSTDNVSWILAPGIVQAGQTGITLTTTTSGDGFFLAGLNTAIPVPSVGLTKSVASTYTTVGAPLTYTFTVTNTSAVPVHTLSVTDPLFVTATNPSGAIPDCTLAGTLAPGASYTCTGDYTITVADIARGFIANTATAHALGAADEPLSNTASAMTTTSTSLSISKIGSPKPVHVGDPFTYTITVSNLGPADAANVTVTDPLPAGLANPAATVTQGAAGSSASISSGQLTATTPLLTHAAPNTFTVTVSGTIAANFTGTSITNTATVVAPNTNCVAGSTDPACSSTDQTDVLQPAPITITKTTTNAVPKPGETFTYTVEVTNTSTTTAAMATVDDAIPPELIGAAWTCAASTGSTCGTPSGVGDLTGVALTLLPLGVATFSITVTVDPTFQGGTITNLATAAPGKYTVCEADPTATECTAEVPVTSTPDPAPLTITKSQSPTTPAQGGAITYTVTVTNTSAFTVARATFDDPVPAQIEATGTWTTATSSPATTATPASGAGFPSTVALVLAPGESVTFTIPATVAATYNGTEITNTATATPGPNTACADGEDPCQAQVSFTNPARLEVAKTHSPTNPHPVPGQQFTYLVAVTNPGNSATGSGTFSDPLPDPPLDAAGATWTCAATGAGSTCGQASGTGSPGVPTGVPITVAPNGGTVTFTITVTIRATAVPVTVHNVGSVTPGTGTECLDGQPTCDGEDTFTAAPETALLTIAKSHTPVDPTPPAAGQPLTYTVVVTNTSAFTTAHATFDDPIPDEIDAGTWSSTTSSPATTATPASGPGFPSGVALVIAPGESVTFTILATVSDTYDGTQVTNTATATPGTNTGCADGQLTCQAEDSFINPARLEVAKTHSPTNPLPVPGQEFTYLVTVTNPGNSATGSGTFSDPLPDPPLDAAGATWTCAAVGTGSTCGEASGTGSPGVPTGVPITVAPDGGTVTFTITVTIRASAVPVTVDNVGSVTPGAGTECVDGQPTCDGEDTFTATPETALLTITKSQDPETPDQGGDITYQVVVTNTSAFTTANATFDDPVPPQIVAGTWDTTTSSPASTATPASGTDFPTAVALVIAPDESVTFTITATVAPTYDGTEVTNTATATPETNTACADGEDPCQAEVSFTNPARLEVAKTHSPTDPDPRAGQPVTYTVTVTNPGSSATGSGTFSDTLPPELDATTATWTCTASTGSSCTPPSTPPVPGSPSDVPITVAPNGGTVIFTITVTIRASGVPVMVDNVGSVTPGPGTECLDGQPTCDGDDSFTAEPTPAPLTIAKIHQPTTPVQGQPFTYTITVTNTSLTTQAEGTINDPLDSPALTGIIWTATATSGSVSPDAGSNSVADVQVTLDPGGTVTFTVHATVRADWPGADVINTAVITPGPDTVCDPSLDPSCSATDDFPTPSLVSIVKTHEPTHPLPQPGQPVLYRVTVTNLSDLQPAQATFDDPLPPQLDRAAARWTAVTTGSGTTATPASGSGPPAGVALTLAPGGSVIFVITAALLPTFAGGTVTNTATATPGDNTACGPEGCDATTSFDPPLVPAPLTIIKSVTPGGPVAPGDTLTYTVTVTNTGTTSTGHGTVTDAIPAGVLALVAQGRLIAGAWTATATAGSSVTPTSGSGPITAQVTVAPGGHVIFTRIVQVDPTFDSDFNIDNVATLAPGANTHCDPTDPTQACNANAVVHVNVPTVPVAPPSPIAPPSLPVTG